MTEQNGSGTAVSIRTMVLDHEERIDNMEAWQSEIRGVITVVKLAVSGSVLTAVLNLLALLTVHFGGG